MFFRVDKIGFISDGILKDQGSLKKIQDYLELIEKGEENIIRNKIIPIQKNDIKRWRSEGTSFKEAYLEYVRRRDFPKLPCRYTKLMVFDDINLAASFLIKFRNNGQFAIYQIDIGDTDYFIGDMNMLDTVTLLRFEDMGKMSLNYWSGKMTQNPIKEYILYDSRKVKYN
jgi:hypothetical protein